MRPKPKKISCKPPKDIRVAAADMSVKEAQYLLEDFYRLKKFLQSTKEHDRLLVKLGTTHNCVAFSRKQIRNHRDAMREMLDIWSENYPEAKWAKRIRGIGSIIASGLAAYIDIDKAKNISSLWKWAGQEPKSRPPTMKQTIRLQDEAVELYGDIPTEEHVKWLAAKLGRNPKTWMRFCTSKTRGINWYSITRAMRHPEYCPMLRQTCIDLGNQFIKHDSMYRDIYRLQLVRQQQENEAGNYAAAAAKQLQTFDFKEDWPAHTAYSAGKLPNSHLKEKAKRIAVKVFLAHYYQIGYYIRYGEYPADCYALDVLQGYKKIHIPGGEV